MQIDIEQTPSGYRHVMSPIQKSKSSNKPKYAAYWIKGTTVYPVPTLHISLVIDHPENFGYTEEQLKTIYEEFNEPYGHEGKARIKIMSDLFSKGWIRVRYTPRNDVWTLELNRLTRKTKDDIWSFFMLLTGHDLDKQKAIDNMNSFSEVRINELNDIDVLKQHSTSISDILKFKGLFEGCVDSGLQCVLMEKDNNFLKTLRKLQEPEFIYETTSYSPNILGIPKYKSFRSFLKEVNYGSMEKDIRIGDITEEIRNDMLENISNKKLYGKIQLGIANKGKNPIVKQYIIHWDLYVTKDNGERNLCTGGHFNNDINGNVITLFMSWNQQKSVDEFKNELYNFIKSYKSNEFIRHEVKHFLDTQVDGKFKNDKYHSINRNDITDKNISKYMSQNSEIEAFLITVLSDLERIYQENREYNTFEEISNKSEMYKQFMKHIIPSKRNKYKNKILHYWFTKHQSRNIVDIIPFKPKS